MSRKNKRLQQILYINICCVIIVLFIVGIFLLKEHPTMAAVDIPNSFNVEANLHMKPDIMQSGAPLAAVQGITISGIEYIMYCYNIALDTFRHADSMTYKEDITDAGLIYLIEHGYPNALPYGGTNYEDYFITQWAIWAYKEEFDGESLKYNTLHDLQTAYGAYSDAFNRLYNGAKAARNAGQQGGSRLSFPNNITLKNVDGHFETEPIQLDTDATSGTYKLQINAPSGYYIVLNNGTVINGDKVSENSYNLKEAFRLVIPTDNITNQNLNVSIKATTTFTNKKLRLYVPSQQNVQNGLLAYIYGEDKHADASTTLTIPKGKLKVAKVTINEQGQTEYVAGATLKIESSNDSNFTPVTFQTTNMPREFTGLIPGKTYTITEVTAPSGFIHNQSSKSYTLTAQDSYTNGDNVATITLQNEYTKICIKKVDKDNPNVTIPNATYDLVEKATGKVVRTWQTTTGPTCFTRLPFGIYQIVERVAPTDQGYIVVPPKDITIGSVENTQNFTSEEDYTKICISKVDKDNHNLLVPNARLQLVNKSTGAIYKDFVTTKTAACYNRVPVGDYTIQEVSAPTNTGYVISPSVDITVQAIGSIQNYIMEDDYTKICIKKVDKDNPNIVIPNARLQLVSKQTGAIYKSFTTTTNETCYDHVPVGEYKLVEIEAPLAAGYVTSPSKNIIVEATAERQNYTFEDDYTKVCIAKVDKYDHTKFVADAKVKLVDKLTGEVVKSFTTTTSPQCYNRLPGGTYKLIETEAPTWEGYVKAAERDITIIDTKEVQTFQFEDDYTKLCIKKVDKDDNLKPVVGARMHLFDKKTGKLIKSFTTREEETCFYKLPVGEYELMEEEAPGDLGYVKMENKDIILRDTEEKQLFMVDDDYTKLCIKKVNPETEELIEGAHLLLTGPNGYKQEIITSKEQEEVCYDHIPVGDYKLEEIKTPPGYITSPTKTFKINDGNRNLIVMDDLLTRVKITKLDGTTGKPLSGVELGLIDSKGQEVRTWFSTEEAYEIVGLPIGKYTLIEKSPLEGYVKIADYEFEIHDRVETVIINVTNDRKVEVPDTASNKNILTILFGLLFISGGGILLKMMYQNKIRI